MRLTARCSTCRRRPSRSSSAPPRSAAMSPMTRSTRYCPRRRSIPSRSRMSSRCSARWASTSSRPRRRATDDEQARGARGGSRRPKAASWSRSSTRSRPSPRPRSRPSAPMIPVRMYLREMGSVELLSREGEIAIAKRIEAGREAMIAGLCESPLTFQAIIIWRDELNEGKVFLRDIIDLEATYAGPDAKAMPAPVIGADGQPIAPCPARRSRRRRWRRRRRRRRRPPARPRSRQRRRAPTARKARRRERAGRRRVRRRRHGELALARRHRGRAQAQGASRPSTTSPTPTSGCAACRTRTSRSSSSNTLALARAGAPLQEAQGRDHHRGEVAAAQPGAHRLAGRAALRHQQAPRRLRGPPDAARREPRRRARGLSQELPGLRARSALAQPRVEAFRQGLEEPRRQGQGQDQAVPPRDPGARRRDRARDRRVPQDRAHGAEGRARGAPGQEGDGGGEPAPRDLDRQEIHQPRPAVPRPDPGRQYRPDEGGRQVRVSPRLQVLDLCHLVDPAGDHAARSPTRRAPSASPCT